MTDLTQRTPAEIDAEIARLHGELVRVEASIASVNRYLARHPNPGSLTRRSYESLERDTERRTALLNEMTPYEAEFARRGGWHRYFLVTNGNGHVHRGMDCTTCYPTTQYAWLIDLADCDEDAMVAEWGERACTVCFPSAPTNPAYHRPARVDREAREQREAEKAVRDEAKAAKTLVEPVRLPDPNGYPDKITTVAAAKQALREAHSDLLTNPVWMTHWDAERHASTERVLRERVRLTREALVRKGVTEEELNRIVTAAERKARKELT